MNGLSLHAGKLSITFFFFQCRQHNALSLLRYSLMCATMQVNCSTLQISIALQVTLHCHVQHHISIVVMCILPEL